MNSLVGVAAPSDPVGSYLVKILHSVEGGDVEQVCSHLETNSPVFAIGYLSHLCFYILHAYIVICLGIVCSHLYSTKRAIAAPQLLSRGILRS